MTRSEQAQSGRQERGLRRLTLGAERGLRGLLGALVIAMVLLNVLNAAGRYLLGTTISGSDEILVYAMVWMVFLGAVLVTRDRAHLSFDIWQRILPRSLVRAQQLFHDLLLLALAVFVCVQSWQVLSRLSQIGQRSMAAGIPMSLPHASVLVGFLLIGAIAAVALWGGIVGRAPAAGPATGVPDAGEGGR